MQQTEHRSFEESDEVRAFPSGHADILNVGEAEIGRLVFEPGWRWSKDVKPIAGTDGCEAPLPVPRGQHARDPDGRRRGDRREAGRRDVPPKGHDAWVIEDEPVVVVDWFGASDYAKGA